MPTDFASTLIFIARLLIGGAFIFAGVRNATNVAALTGLMAGRGVPQARAVLVAGIVLQIVAGALLITGPWIALAAAGLIVFVVTATPIFHNFWDHQGLDRGNRINGIVSNVAWVGGLLLVIATAHNRQGATRSSTAAGDRLSAPSDSVRSSPHEETGMTTAAILMIAGRVIFGAFFLIAGVRNFLHFERTQGARHQLRLAVAGAAAGDRFCRAAAWRSLAHPWSVARCRRADADRLPHSRRPRSTTICSCSRARSVIRTSI